MQFRIAATFTDSLARLTGDEQKAVKTTARDRVSVGTMHLSKGLEFRAVAVMACDDEVVPLQARIEGVTDEVTLRRCTTPNVISSTRRAPVRAIICW